MPTLYPYQREGAAFLASKGRALLADEPGLGKTAQAITALRQLEVPYFLVICPASVVGNWKREIERWWPGNRGWNVISYDRATRDHGKVQWLAKGGSLVVDEAHYAKSSTAKRTQAIFGKRCDGKGGLIECASHCFLLTGTPMPNAPDELWPMLRAVMPESILGAKTGKPLAYWPFTMRYCQTRDDGFGIKIVGGKNLAELKARISPFYMRRRKAEVLTDLPPLTIDVLPLTAALPLSTLGEARLAAEALAARGIDGLAELAPHVATLRRLTGLAKVAPMVEWVKDQLDGGMRKIVLFAQHREVIEGLAKGIATRHGAAGTMTGFNEVVTLTGASTQAQRQFAIDQFQDDKHGGARVFIGQIQAAGTGITLTAASDLVFVESSWVPTENEQAAMRIHRIGQRNACTVRFASVAGSIDEQIAAACARKLETINAVFG
jgi:SWI/SNF-related matrix-associated actin-dependent regulator 1 of chromatin subfamily A